MKKIITVLIILLFPCFAGAELNVDRAIIEVDRSLREEGEERLRISPEKILEFKKREKEKEKKGAKFLITEIKLVGCESFPPREFAEIIKKYENKKNSLEELEVFAEQIEKEYLRKGIIAACFLSPQEIKEQTVTLQVIEAKMGNLEITEHKYFNKRRLSYYWGLKPDKTLYYDRLSRSVQLMNKNSDRNVKAKLLAGKKTHTTDVLLDVQTHFPIHLTYSFDREGSIHSGREKNGIGIKHNNFLGLDDVLSGGYSFGKHFNSLYAYHTLPISNFGTSLMYGYSYSKSFPKGDYDSFGIDARTKTTNISIHQDIFKKDEYLGEIYFGIDAKDKTVKMNTGTTNRDRLRILKFGSNLIYSDINNTVSIKPEISQGINLFGARRKNSLSSKGAKNTFTKFNLEFQHKRFLPLDLQTNLKFNSQLSSTRLTPQERFSLGGINTVRGYPEGDYSADNAFLINLELLFPAFFIPEKLKIPYARHSLKKTITPLIFFDYGYGRVRESGAAGGKTCNLRSAGVGFKIRLFNQAILRLEWGFPLGDKTIGEAADSRFHFSVVFEDKFP
ncbi:MAG: BamA/TamA family outer membrane protein, partial [Candidatus Omnitrophica bacterium]|nr:BamA/TamA family outer membrane protein [Candidatus Omnitrophota bacterium]